ncbi:DUF3048 domain-containing protein [Nocardioides sp. W3-2-3]|nr:DUF3048 domain-containing protein [Nocardioides convexus]
MRASDIGIVSPVKGVITTSGAAGVTIDRINRAKIKFFAEGGPGFYRDSSRHAPYNLFTSLKKVAKKTEDGKDQRPADYLPWGSAADLPAGKPASSLSAHFGSRTTNWSFQGGKYVNTNSNAAKGDRFQPDTVLVLRVKVVDAGYRDPAGNFVPESKFKGTGAAQIFHNGRSSTAPGRRRSPTPRLTLSTAAGALKVPAGKVWIESGAGRRQRRIGDLREVAPQASSAPGSGISPVSAKALGLSRPCSTRLCTPASRNPIAPSTRIAAASGSSEVATDSPAEDIAPKKIREKVCSIGSSSSQEPAASVERTISTMLAYVERSSCSRKRS